MTLVPKSEAHVVTLHEARVVHGKVTDRETGELIKKFQTMPVIEFWPGNYSTGYVETKQGADGRYEVPLRGSGDGEYRCRFRFEADRYPTLISDESYGPTDGRAELNVRLEPAPPREGRVVSAAGEPVAGAVVIEGTPTWVPHVHNSEPDS